MKYTMRICTERTNHKHFLDQCVPVLFGSSHPHPVRSQMIVTCYTYASNYKSRSLFNLPCVVEACVGFGPDSDNENKQNLIYYVVLM